MAKITVHKDKDWNLNDYKTLYELIESMSVDVEGMAFAATFVEKYKDDAESLKERGFESKEYYLKCLSYVAGILDIINDVPKSQVEMANEEYNLGIKPYSFADE